MAEAMRTTRDHGLDNNQVLSTFSTFQSHRTLRTQILFYNLGFKNMHTSNQHQTTTPKRLKM